jgi:Zn/Cd-binding protein ZinT
MGPRKTYFAHVVLLIECGKRGVLHICSSRSNNRDTEGQVKVAEQNDHHEIAGHFHVYYG